MLIIYHLIAMTAFHLEGVRLFQREHGTPVFTRKYKVQNHIFKLITILILILSYIMCIITPNSSYAAMTLEEVFITLLFALTITADLFAAYKAEKISDFACDFYHGFMGVYALFGVMLILQFGTCRLPEVLLSYALCVILLPAAETQKNKYIIAAQIPLFLIALFSLISIESSAQILYLPLGTVLLMLAGYPIILLMVTMVFSTFAADTKNLLIETYRLDAWFSKIRHLKTILAFSIAGIFHIWMTKKNGFQNREEKIMARIINAAIMLSGCSAISYHELPLLPIIVAIGVFTLNTREILAEEERKNNNSKKKYWIMAYILLKYTILLLVILNSFQTPEFLISISLLIFAVLSIIAGFWKQKKGYRLYGLALSMISIFKLIMLDANMKEAVTGSISFIVCGLLCFAISFIYNKIQKEYFDDVSK